MIVLRVFDETGNQIGYINGLFVKGDRRWYSYDSGDVLIVGPDGDLGDGWWFYVDDALNAVFENYKSLGMRLFT